MWRSPRLWVAVSALVTIPLLALLEPLERSGFDARLKMRSAGEWPGDLVMVPIDDATLQARGRWPWSRTKIAALLEATKAAGARTVTLDAVLTGLTEPEDDAALEKALDRVVLAVGGSRQGGGAPVDARLRGSLFTTVPANPTLFDAENLVVPHARFASAAAGLGHSMSFPSKDEVIRGHAPLIALRGEPGAFGSLALMSLAQQRGWSRDALAVDGDTLVLPEGRRLRLFDGDAYLDWVPRDPAPRRRISAERILSGDAGDELEGALALVYIDSESTFDRAIVPGRGVVPGGVIVANAIRTLDFGRTPRPVPRMPVLGAVLAILLLAAGRLSKMLPRELFLAGALGAVTFVVAATLLVPFTDLFLPIASPAALSILACSALAIRADRLADVDRKRLKDLLADAAKLPKATIGPDEDRETIASNFRPRESTLGALASGSPLARPVDVGRYTITRCLGRGGMGAIFLAHDNELEREVALKVLTAVEPVAFERFRREAQAVARIDHPNVVRIHEIGADAEVPFLVIEYVNGGSVAEWFRGWPQNQPWPPPWHTSLPKIRDAAAGLGAAHALGIVHRDVKPANILLTSEGAAKIADFGIAKLGGSATLTREGSMVGTIGYLSPEQATGVDVDPRSDVYSLGITWYRLLTGRSAFDGTTAEILRRQISSSVTDPRRVVPDLPAPIAELVVRMAALQREDRPDDGRAVAKEIDAIAASLGR